MKRYVDAEKLKEEIDRQKIGYNIDGKHNAEYDTCVKILHIIDSLQQEPPEDYFYCKYGGTRPLCGDCKRNHSNSPYTTDDIKTWYCPLNLGTKQCSDYIKKQ